MPKVQRYRLSANLSEDAKILLIIDRCAAHPDNEKLSQGNNKMLFLPPNCTSFLQPMDMDILHFFKCNYKNNLLHWMLEYVNDGKNISELTKRIFNKGCSLVCCKSIERYASR